MGVKTGDVVVGSMKQVGVSGDRTDWMVEAGIGRNVSSYTAKGIPWPDAAYLTLEGMLIYNCNDYPPNGDIAFSNNVIAQKGKGVDWTPVVRHSECGQAVKVDKDGTVHLTWKPTNTTH